MTKAFSSDLDASDSACERPRNSDGVGTEANAGLEGEDMKSLYNRRAWPF